MPVVVPSLWSTGSPPVHRNCVGLSACRNRGALGVPSRIANPPFRSRSSEKVLCSPQCTQSRAPSAVRSTLPGTPPVAIAIAPLSGGRVVFRLVAGGEGGRDVAVGAGDDVGVPSGISPGLALG